MTLSFYPKKIGIIIKISERCNIACTYCYFFNAGDMSYKQHPPIISNIVIDDVVNFLNNAIYNFGIESISIIFHGGEPLLMKKNSFNKMCEIISKNLKNHCRLNFGLQTNAMLIDDIWIEIFERFRIGVGVSLDGPQIMNDEQRLDRRGRGTYDRTISGLRQLQVAAAKGQIGDIGVICVVDPKRSGAAIYRHFVDDLQLTNLHFLPLDMNHETVDKSVVNGTLTFLLNVFRSWVRDNNPKIRIRFFSQLISAFLSDRGMETIGDHREDTHTLFTVSSDGTLGAEDVVRTLHPRFADTGLNVRSANFEDMISLPQWHEMARCTLVRPEACSDCIWWRVCRGGHIPHRYSAKAGLERETIYCSTLKELYAEIAAYLIRGGLKLEELQQRLEMPEKQAAAKISENLATPEVLRI